MLAPALASCSFAFSAGGPDYEKLENGISDELNTEYTKLSTTVSEVDCPKPAETPKSGDKFVCTADVDGQKVRVEVTVEEDDNVSFSTLDSIFDLKATGRDLTRDVSNEYGFDVTVDCGEGLEVVANGESFDCAAADRKGDTRTVQVTAGGPDKDDNWEVLD
jgi:hypothetical protein